MPKSPLLSDDVLYQAATALYLEKGNVTVADVRRIAKELGGGVDTTRAMETVRRVKADQAHAGSVAEAARGVGTPNEIRQALPAVLQAILQHLDTTLVATLRQLRSELRDEADKRLADARREHDAALDAMSADKEALQGECSDLRETITQAEQRAIDAHERAATGEEALVDLRVQTDQRQAEHHAEILRLTERIGAAQRDKDEAVQARYDTEQRLHGLEQQAEWARQEIERERARADAASDRADALEQRLEQARTAERAAAQETASLRAAAEGKDALLRQLERELARCHREPGTSEPVIQQDAGRNAAD